VCVIPPEDQKKMIKVARERMFPRTSLDHVVVVVHLPTLVVPIHVPVARHHRTVAKTRRSVGSGGLEFGLSE
jgi:hypothetical protein